MYIKIKIEYYRFLLNYWLKRVEKSEKLKLFNIYEWNKMNFYLQKIDDLYFGGCEL